MTDTKKPTGDAIIGDDINSQESLDNGLPDLPENFNDNFQEELDDSVDNSNTENTENQTDVPAQTWDINTFSDNEAIKFDDETVFTIQELKEIAKLSKQNKTNSSTQQHQNNNENSTNPTVSQIAKMAGYFLKQIYKENSEKYPTVEFNDVVEELKKIPNPDFDHIEPVMKKIHEKNIRIIEKYSKNSGQNKNSGQFAGENKLVPPAQTAKPKPLSLNDIDSMSKAVMEFLNSESQKKL